jgi:NADH-quinone oxidoreductase subunit N
MTPSISYVGLLPELLLVATLCTILVVDLFVSDRPRRWFPLAACMGTGAALVSAIALFAGSTYSSSLGGAYVVDAYALLAKLVVLAIAVGVLALGGAKQWKGEYLLLILGATIGMSLIVSAREIVTYIVAFELLAMPGYLLVGWNKRARLGNEAALKYFLLGVVSTAVMLYGASLVFGAAGSTLFSDIASANLQSGEFATLAALGAGLVVVGLAFKVSAIPFHFWAPDAYQGAPIQVAAFLSTISKAAALFAIPPLLVGALGGVDQVWAPLLAVIAAVTAVAGSILALRQGDLIRILAYSSIAQGGFALVPISLIGYFGGDARVALEALYVFVAIYVVGNLAAFAMASAMSISAGSSSLAAMSGLFRAQPVAGFVMTIALLSLAGIPPIAGWFAKFVVFRSALEAGGVVGIALAIALAVATAIGLVFYARVLSVGWSESTQQFVVGPKLPVIIGSIAAIALLVLGVFPGLIGDLASQFIFDE